MGSFIMLGSMQTGLLITVRCRLGWKLESQFLDNELQRKLFVNLGPFRCCCLNCKKNSKTIDILASKDPQPSILTFEVGLVDPTTKWWRSVRRSVDDPNSALLKKGFWHCEQLQRDLCWHSPVFRAPKLQKGEPVFEGPFVTRTRHCSKFAFSCQPSFKSP